LPGLGHPEGVAAQGQGPPQRHQRRGQGQHVERLLGIAHEWASARTEECQDSARRSMARNTALMITPRKPVAMTRAYIGAVAPPDWARAISLPRPGLPMTSSAVTARISATAAPRRNPVIR